MVKSHLKVGDKIEVSMINIAVFGPSVGLLISSTFISFAGALYKNRSSPRVYQTEPEKTVADAGEQVSPQRI